MKENIFYFLVNVLLLTFTPTIDSIANCALEMFDTKEDLYIKEVVIPRIVTPKDDEANYTIINEISGNTLFNYKLKLNTNLEHELEVKLSVSDLPEINEANYTACYNKRETFQLHTLKTIHIKKKDLNSIYIKNKTLNGSKLQNVCKNSVCSMVIPINFKYVYTGCYIIEVMTKINDKDFNTERIFGPLLVKTKYQKTLPEDIRLYTTTKKAYTNINTIKYSIDFYVDINHTTISGFNKELYNEIKPRVFLIQLKGFNESYPSLNCVIDDDRVTGNHKNCNEDCTLKHKSEEYFNGVATNPHRYNIQCNKLELISGDYCVFFRILDERCNHRTVWINDKVNLACSMTHPFNVSEKVPDNLLPVDISSENREENKTAILISIIIIIMGVILFVLVIRYPIKVSYNSVKSLFIKSNSAAKETAYSLVDLPSQEIPSDYIIKLQEHVLLLYARDCESVTDIVIIFRSILRENNCKVYDLYEDSIYLEVSANPVIWLMSRLNKDYIKIIVIANSSSKLLESRFWDEESMEYRHPNCFDDLFLIGLNYLVSSKKIKNGMVYVVSFEGESSKETDVGFKYLNVQNLYYLPLNLNELIRHIHNDYGIEPKYRMNNSNLVKEFQQKIEGYDPESLQSLFKIDDS